MLRTALVLLSAISLLGAVPLDPDAAFNATRDAMDVVHYPRYADYQVVVRYTLGQKPMTATWSTFEDLQRRNVRAQPFSEQEAANPHVATGTNFGIMGYTLDPVKGDDAFGLMSLAINQDYGLARNLPPITVSTDAKDVDGPTDVLRSIGRTGADARTYKIVRVGMETVNGKQTVHLALTPLKDPKRNRLRDLWVDNVTNLPVRATVAGITAAAPLTDATWTVDFATDDFPFLAKESTTSVLDTDLGEVTNLSISFEKVQTMHYASALDKFGYSLDKGITDP